MQVKRSCTLPGNGHTVAELSALSTSELVALAQAGQREAFDPLYRRYAAQILRYAMRLADWNRPVAEDIAAETWTTALAEIDRFTGDGSGDEAFVKWLYGVTRGSSKRRHAYVTYRERPSEHAGRWSAEDRMVAAGGPGEDEDPRTARMRAGLLAAVKTLAPVQRRVVLMRLDGMDTGEIAPAAGLTVEQVRRAWELAQASLRRRLAGPLDRVDPAKLGQLREAALSLPSSLLRQVALLRLDGVPLGEIARLTGHPYGRVQNAWFRAEDALRRHIDVPVDAAPVTSYGFVSDTDRAKLRAAAQTLPEIARTVALLRLDGLTNQAIADRLGCPVGAVRGAWFRAWQAFAAQGLVAASPRQKARQPVDPTAADNPDVLRAAAQALPPAARRIALLRLDGLSTRAVADQVGRSYGTVASTWSRARQVFASQGLAVA